MSLPEGLPSGIKYKGKSKRFFFVSGILLKGLERKRVKFMATSSITKRFIIKDDATFENLIKASKKPKKRVRTSNAYEEGKKQLKQYFGR